MEDKLSPLERGMLTLTTRKHEIIIPEIKILHSAII